MRYAVNHTADFGEWWRPSLWSGKKRTHGYSCSRSLGRLGRSTVDRIHMSAFRNMKELRCSGDGAVRVLFAFDSAGRPSFLGGNKAGNWDAWYDAATSGTCVVKE